MNHNKNQLIVLSDQGLVSGVNFTVSAILARYLGLEQFGLFALGWMVVLFASSIHQAFVIAPLYTVYPKSEDRDRYRKDSLFIQILFTIAIFFLSLLATEITLVFKPEWQFGFTGLIIAYTSAVFVLNDYFRRLFFVRGDSYKTLISDIIGYGFQPIFFVILWKINALDIRNAFLVIASLLSISTVVSWMVFHKESFNTNCKNTLLKNWKFSKYLIGTSLLQWFTGNLFILIGGSLLGPFAVGAVRMAQNIVGVLHVLFLALENIVPARAAEIMTQYGEKRMFRHIGRTTLIAGIPTLIILSLITFVADDLIIMLYGSEYLEFKTLLYAFAGLYILVFIGTMVRFAIRTQENNKIILTSYVVGTIASLAIVHPSVSTFGVYGVVLGLFVTQIINISIYLFSLKTQLKWLFK